MMVRRLILILLVALLTLGQAAPPRLTPNQGTAGTTVEVTVDTALSPSGSVAFEPQGFLQPLNLRANADGQLQFTLQISPNAPATSFAFVYQPPPGIAAAAPPTLRVPNAFTVLAAPAPVRIRSIAPTSIEAGAPPVALQIAGSGFKPGAQLSFSGAGVSAGATQVNRAGDSLTTTVSAAAGAAAGPRSVIVTNPDGTSNSDQVPAVQIGVTAPPPPRPQPPAVVSIAPARLTIGGPAVLMQIAGTNFAQGAKVAITGVTVNVLTVAEGLIRGEAALTPSAAPGQYPVVVTNPDGQSNANQQPPVRVEIVAPPPAPVVTAATPDAVEIGSVANVQIAGKNFTQGSKVSIAGTSVSLTSIAPAAIGAQVSTLPGAAPGAVPIVVTNPDGQSNANQQPPVTFTLVAPKPKVQDPVVRSIEPDAMELGAPAKILRIRGSNFAQGARVSIQGLDLTSTTVEPDGTMISVRATTSPNATRGAVPVIVTNPDGRSNAAQQPPVLFGILPGSPAILEISPRSIPAGAKDVPVTFTGVNFDAGASLALAGSGASVADVIVLDARRMQAKVSADPATAPGPREVTVRNPNGKSNAQQSPMPRIEITAPPPPEKKPPFVRSIAPDRAQIGGPAMMLQIAGTNFQQGASLSIAGLAVTIVSISPDGGTMVARGELAPSAAPGTSPVIVTNPDGLSNAAQTPPVTFLIAAEPVVQKPPEVPPTKPPEVPVTKPPEPTKPPEVTKPPEMTKPPARPPTELLVGPRIDLVSPNQLVPGEKYSLELQGKNLTPDTKISFGKSVTIVGAPFITSPTSAKVDVLVAPAATPGAIPAAAANAKGSNSGPGGIYVSVAKKPATPGTPKPVTPVAEKKFKQPTGTIILDAPCDPDALFSKQCEQPVTLNDSTLFVWHELNPGIAKFFVFEIVDGDGKVIFSAQTNKKYYRLSAANLASLPSIVPLKGAKVDVSEKVVVGGSPAGKAPSSKPGDPVATAQTQVKGPKGSGGKAKKANIAPGDTKGLTDAMKNAEVTSAAEMLEFSKRPPAFGEVSWRVKGMANKIDEYLGIKLPEMVQAEDSAERAIVLPLPPNGFTCEAGTTGTYVGEFTGRWDKYSKIYPKRPKPCPDNSMNVCSEADFAEFSPDAKLDLTRVPFNLRQVGELNSSQVVTFQNVFIDWGDGSEPKPLKVKGTLTKGKQSLKALRLIPPGTDENARISHRYVNDDIDAEFVTYKVRIFSVYDPDALPVFQVAGVTQGEAKPSGSLAAKGFGSQTVPAGGVGSAASGPKTAAKSSASPGQASASTASTSKAADFLTKMFTIACGEVEVWNPWGVGADEPIHLLTARLLFPTDSADTKALIKSLKGEQGAAMQAPAGSVSAEAKASASGPAAGIAPQGQQKAGIKPQPTGAKSATKTPAPGAAQAQAGGKIPFGGDLAGLPIPEISDCSSAFKAAAQITYWGVGRIRVFWYVDGVLVESQALPNELPRVSTADGEAGKKPYVLTMVSALPAVLQAPPHRVHIKVEVVKPPLMEFGTGKVTGAKLIAGASGGKSGKSVKLGPTQQSYTQVNQTVKKGQGPSNKKGAGIGTAALGKSDQASVNTFTLVEDPLDEPGERVESPARYYTVFDHKERKLPCRIRYATAQTGTFEISDLSALTRAVDGSFSGTGSLHLHLPDHDGDSIALWPIIISFTQWQLAQESQEDEDTLVAEGGSYEKTMDSSLSAMMFPVALKKIQLTPERLVIDGTVGLLNGTGFTNETVEQLPRWEFATAPLSADGDFRFTKEKPQSTKLGASGFEMKIASAEIDFSRKEGSGPTQPCGSVPTDATWQGIRLDGVLAAPPALEIAKVALLKDYPFSGWGVGPAGLSVNFSDPAYTRQVSKSGVQVNVKGFNFKHCNGSFGAPTFGLEVSNAPLVVQKISGTISMDEFAQLHPSFPAVNVQHDWGNVRTKITGASFLWNTLVNNFVVDIKSHFWFEVNDKESYDSDYDGVLITLDGNVFAPNGEHYFPVPGAATANIAGYPMQVTSLGVGNSDTGDIWFGFRGDIEPGEMAPTAKDKEAKYLLTKTSSAALTGAGAPYEVASLDASALGTEQDFGYSTGTAGGVTVQQIHLDFSYPPSSKTVQVTADCMWHQEGSSYFFIGEGQVKVLDSIGVEIGALFGRDVSDSYWLVKAAVDFPTMIAFGSTGLGMDRIHGGLGYSVPISAFDMPELIQVKTDKSKAYLFSAGIGVGTMDAFTLYADGTLTVKLGGPDAGVRLSVSAWLLNSEHAQPPLAQACMQYAGGAFDAGMTMHLELGGGLAVIDAPASGPDICTQAAVQVHFGGSEDWHIWIGQETLPLSAKLLIIDGKGYLMIDGQGVEMFNGIYVDKQWSASIAGFGGYVKVWGAVEINGVMTYAPFHIAGGLAGSISAKAGADIAGGCCSVGFGVNLKFAAAAPPVEVCGKVGVHFSTPWPLPDVNASVGPLCLGG